MTNEEAIKLLKDGQLSDSEVEAERFNEAYNMAIKALETVSCIKEKCAYCPHCENCDVDDETLEIKALEQQPCEDAISRQAVDELSKELVHTTRDKADFLCSFWEGLQKLPPVTPKEKTGRWISFGIQGEIDGQIVRAFTCSKCGAISIFRVSNGNIVNGDLCPNCGAKMEVNNEYR